MPQKLELLNQKFGHLTVTAFAGVRNGRTRWNCKCDCGKEVEVDGFGLNGGHSRSCGCLRRYAMLGRRKTHGMTGTKEYRAWSNAKGRCLNPKNDEYPNYGGRGISMCDRWLHSFENFIADMGKAPTKSHSIERVDVNGNYEPSNCVWATKLEQASNKRTTIAVTFNGRTLTLKEWSAEIGVPVGTIHSRRRHGMGVDWVLFAGRVERRGGHHN